MPHERKQQRGLASPSQWEGRDPGQLKAGDLVDWMLLSHAGTTRAANNPGQDHDEYTAIPVTLISRRTWETGGSPAPPVKFHNEWLVRDQFNTKYHVFEEDLRATS